MKTCAWCGKEFEVQKGRSVASQRYCSPRHRNNAKLSRYRGSDLGKAAARRYRGSDLGKAAARRCNASAKGKAAARRYRTGPKSKAKNARYWASPKGQATKQAKDARYNAGPKSKAKDRRNKIAANIRKALSDLSALLDPTETTECPPSAS